jgi:hypothetical protein
LHTKDLKRQKDRKTERQKDRKTEQKTLLKFATKPVGFILKALKKLHQRDRGRRDRKRERQKDRKTERKKKLHQLLTNKTLYGSMPI